MSFGTLAPELVWGLIPRVVGLLYVLAFVPVYSQHDIMPGSSRLTPIGQVLARMRRDFPGLRRFFDLPTLLWINSSDAMQRGMCIVGALCGAMAVYGGPFSFYALLVAWLCWLSLETRGLVFPWDTMLQEVGFLVLFLPASQALPNLHASALPLPSVAFMVRWLVLRLMLGFAKDKFLQTTKSDFLYLRGFFVWMPMPSPLGWYAHHLPAWVLRLMLLFMFVAEAIAPVLGLFSGTLRLVSFGLLVALMIGIHATGNWGYFNIGYALLCVSLLDTQSSIFDLGQEPWASTLTHWPDLAIHISMGLMFVASLFYLPTNSWLMRSWTNVTPDMFALKPKLTATLWRWHRALAPLRALAPFRIVNGYGVFPPNSAPPMRLTPVLEGSDDGVHWKQYGYRHMPSFAHQRPPFIAPYHSRLDQWTFYVTMGMDTGSLFGSLTPAANPYIIYTRAMLFDQLAQRLLANDPKVLRFFGHNPFPDAPPKLVRVSILALTPTRIREQRATGQWWHIRRVGTFLPPRGLESWPDRLLVPEPELFHPDLVRWKRRAAPLRAISAAYAQGMSADRAVLEGSDLTPQDVERFWNELVPMLGENRGDWSRIHEQAAAVEARFGVEGLYRLERVLERYAWLLRGAAEPYRQHGQGTRTPSLPVMTNFHFHMLLHEQIIDGRAAYRAALAAPAQLVELAARSTAATQLWVLAQLRYDHLMAHVRCFRTYEMGLDGMEGLPSFFEYHDFIKAQVPPGEEFHPKITKHPNGEYTIEGFYPPPPLLASDAGALDDSSGITQQR